MKINKAQVQFFLFISCLLCGVSVIAQKARSNGFVNANFGKPIVISSADSSFTLGISGRIQNLAESQFDLKTEKNTVDFSIRRLRLNLAGTALSPKFTYRIQLNFSQRDISSNNSEVQNNLFLRDAMLFYAPNNQWRFGFGQTKLPGNRQRQVSSANLQMVDRSNTNALFTLDRDKGFWVFNKQSIGKRAVLKNTAAITSGEGRINSDKTAGLCYSFRSEILPFGDFKNGGDYVESDLEHEDNVKLSLAFVYSYNNKTSRVAGQLGDYLYNRQLADITYYGSDVMMKYKGWSFLGELFRRKSDNGVSINPTNPSKVNFVYSGTGLLLQSGYLVTPKNEIVLRYGFTNPDDKVDNYVSKLNEYVIGYSHYFFKHQLKLQTDASFLKGADQEIFQLRFTGIITF